MAEGVGTGTTLALSGALSSYAPEIVSFGLDGEEVPVIDMSKHATTGYREKLFGSLKEPPQLTIEINYDPGDVPVVGTTVTATVTWPDSATMIGTGAIISQSSETPLEDKMSGTFVFQFDGQTGPTYSG